MNNEQRLEAIREKLQSHLAPQEIQLRDDSDQHIGHPGARDGRGHFSVRIVAAKFNGLAKLARHRLIYAILADLMQTEIHALSIEAIALDEI